MAHPFLYQVNARQWLASLSLRHGRRLDLETVPEVELESLQRTGFTHLWLMGVWPTGAKSRQQAVLHPDLRTAYSEALPDWSEADIVGSPYAVADYVVDPALGGERGLAAFRSRLHALGLRLILDFVPNHLGLDHPWIASHPERFVSHHSPFPDSFPLEVRGAVRHLAHGKDPYFAGWTDTVQLDYRREETRSAMADVLLSIASRCDGVRCDMAMLPLNEVFMRTWAHLPSDDATAGGEFWKAAIERVKGARPDFTFLAEAYWGLEGALCELGFDYAYDKRLYDLLVHDHCWEVQPHILGMGEHNRQRAHFLENHDEPRIAASLDTAQHKAAALLVLGLPGMRFLHDGQFEGLRRFARVQLGRRALEPKDETLEALYSGLLHAFRESALLKGEAQVLVPQRAWADNPTSQCFSVIQWNEPGNADAFDLVVVNHAPHSSQCRVPLLFPQRGNGSWLLRDRLGSERWERQEDELASSGLFLDAGPRGALLFSFTRA